MTTYTVTINGETYLEVTAATLKTMKKNNKNVKAVKNIETPVTKCYYRGNEITVIEERQLGWSLVYSGSTSNGNYKQFFAVTAEVEYR